MAGPWELRPMLAEVGVVSLELLSTLIEVCPPILDRDPTTTRGHNRTSNPNSRDGSFRIAAIFLPYKEISGTDMVAPASSWLDQTRNQEAAVVPRFSAIVIVGE